MAGGLRAVGPKADIALIVADEDAVVGGAFTQNVMCAAPVIYCKEVLAKKSTCRAVSTYKIQYHMSQLLCSYGGRAAHCI